MQYRVSVPISCDILICAIAVMTKKSFCMVQQIYIEQDLRCPYMAEDMFSHGAFNIF